jgi:SAM-dependent methyltransferase
MHPSSMKNMELAIEKYVNPLREAYPSRKLKIVDIGAQNVNGSYRTLFPVSSYDYLGADLSAGKGVDLVIGDPYHIPIGDNHADLVISGQMLEHNEFFWLTFSEKIRIVNRTGYVIMIAPSRGRIHRYPVDCYRFYPDSYAALAKYTNSILIDCWLDAASPWGDLVGVFIKEYRHGITVFDTSQIKN